MSDDSNNKENTDGNIENEPLNTRDKSRVDLKIMNQSRITHHETPECEANITKDDQKTLDNSSICNNGFNSKEDEMLSSFKTVPLTAFPVEGDFILYKVIINYLIFIIINLFIKF